MTRTPKRRRHPVLFFPESFLFPDGRFRETMPGDFVPAHYITVNGERRCGSCLNRIAPDIEPFTTPDPKWRIVDFELLYEGPPVKCGVCGYPQPTLYGDPAEDISAEIF